MNPQNDVSIVLPRRELCMRLRRNGLSYREIAAQTGLNLSTVYDHVKAAIAEVRELCHESAQEVIDVQRSRLDQLYQATVPGVEQGDPQAINAAKAIVTEILKVEGGYAPTKIAPTTPDGDEPYKSLTDEQLAAALICAAQQLKGDNNGD